MHSEFINKLEEDLKPVLEAIEKRGLYMDVQKMAEIISGLGKERRLAELRAYDLFETSHRINLNSSQELLGLLAELNIDGSTLPRTKRGTFSTAKDVLEKIKHPAIEHVIAYRSLTKLIATLDSYYRAVDMVNPRLFYKFTNDCASGRLYTKDVSIQNLPHEGRFAIIPGPGSVFVSADYDMFELKILSALSGDKYFKQCWEQGIDLHRKVVADMKGIPYEQVTDSLRKQGKILNFGLAYGQEPPGIAFQLGIPLSEAEKLVAEYLGKIPEIVQFKKDCVKKAMATGYIETYFGRRRDLPDISAKDFPRCQKAQRQSVNTPIQGTGGDIAKMVMVKLHNAGWQIDAMLHDGFLISVPCDAVEESIARIKEVIEIDLNGLKLTVSCKVGMSWGDCK
jgi:DNA polymerase I